MVMCVCLAVFCAACGKSGPVLAPPKNMGTPEQLAGSSWSSEFGTFSFVSQNEVTFMPSAKSAGKMPLPDKPLSGNYSINQGVVRGIISGAQPFAGTWDGQKLVIYDQEWKRDN